MKSFKILLNYSYLYHPDVSVIGILWNIFIPCTFFFVASEAPHPLCQWQLSSQKEGGYQLEQRGHWSALSSKANLKKNSSKRVEPFRDWKGFSRMPKRKKDRERKKTRKKEEQEKGKKSLLVTYQKQRQRVLSINPKQMESKGRKWRGSWSERQMLRGTRVRKEGVLSYPWG